MPSISISNASIKIHFTKVSNTFSRAYKKFDIDVVKVTGIHDNAFL